MASSSSPSSLVLDEARLLLSRTLFPIFLLAPMTTTVEEQSHVDVVHRLLVHQSWSSQGWSNFVAVDGPSRRIDLVSSYLLSVLAYPLYRSDPDFDIAATLRVVLSLLSALSSVWLARRIRPTFGTRTAKYYLVFEATQVLATREMTRLDGVSLAVPLVRVASALLIAPRLPSPLDADDRPRAGGIVKARSIDILFGLGLLALASVALCPALIALWVPSLWSAWSSGLVDGVQAMGVVGSWLGIQGALTSLIELKSTDPQLVLPTLRAQLSALISTPNTLDRNAVLLPYLTLLGPTLLFSSFAFLVDGRCRRLLGPAFVALGGVYYFGLDGGGGDGMGRARVMVLVSSTACSLCAASSARVLGIMFGMTAQNLVLGSVIVGNLYLAFASTARATV